MSSFPRSSDPSEGSTTPPNDFAENKSLTPTHTITEPDFPEGGLLAWCTALGAFLVRFCGFGYTGAFGVYQAFYAQHYLQNESASAVSWIGSLDSFLITALGPLCGRLFDNGYFYHVYITGAVLQCLAIFMLSLVQPGKYYQVFLAQGLASGIGQGLVYVPSMAILSHHFKRRRTMVTSIVASGSPLGGIVHTIMLNKLLDGPIGFKTSVQISAAFVTILMSLSCILVRPRYGVVRRKSIPVSFWKATKKCFVEVPSLLTILGFTLFQTAFFYPYFYFQVDSTRHGLSNSFAFYSLVIINAGSFIGRFTIGTVLPFIGVVDLTIITTVVCAILIIGMIWLGSVASVVVLGLLYGAFSGINVAMMAPMFGLTSDPAELGVRIGVGYAVAGIGGLVGPPICGALLTTRYLWWAPSLFCAAIALAASISFIRLRFLFSRTGIGSPMRSLRGTTDKGEEGLGCERKETVKA